MWFQHLDDVKWILKLFQKRQKHLGKSIRTTVLGNVGQCFWELLPETNFSWRDLPIFKPFTLCPSLTSLELCRWKHHLMEFGICACYKFKGSSLNFHHFMLNSRVMPGQGLLTFGTHTRNGLTGGRHPGCIPPPTTSSHPSSAIPPIPRTAPGPPSLLHFLRLFWFGFQSWANWSIKWVS